MSIIIEKRKNTNAIPTAYRVSLWPCSTDMMKFISGIDFTDVIRNLSRYNIDGKDYCIRFYPAKNTAQITSANFTTGDFNLTGLMTYDEEKQARATEEYSRTGNSKVYDDIDAEYSDLSLSFRVMDTNKNYLFDAMYTEEQGWLFYEFHNM